MAKAVPDGVIEGVRPILEAMRAGRRRVREIQIPKGRHGPNDAQLLEWARRARVRITEVASESARGIRAVADPYPEVIFEEILAGAGSRRLVALDGVTDVGNLGSIGRSAEAAGVTGMVLEERHAPPVNAGALRASAGALEHLRVSRVPSLRKALALAKAEGLTILAADPDGEPLGQVDSARLGAEGLLLLGSEDRGIRPALRGLADLRLAIPMRGRIQSLGVAAAAAFLLLSLAERWDAASR